ncbi:hypothetical protein KOR42_40330 [Thalassoglobus neptunius]|uniref:Uncharacterized protein n=1 Tax=Thalassoglobus neptunius TaxID=1938619 RepID=A0A5C5WB97_9PLAN|nr:phage integrase SAM-like domain-containing protein [Thalassoglobus neptunius]TWT47950.1 hypothetical protein KOR42_40330 [Thalassoglobus neptunius]
MFARSQQRSADTERSSILKFPTLYNATNDGLQSPTEKITLRQYYNQELLPTFREEQSPRSLTEDRCALNHWERITGDPDIRAVNTETLIGFRDGLTAAGRSPHTVNKIWRELKSIFECAVEDGLIDKAPKISRRMKSTLVKAPKKRQREMITALEAERLWKV